MSIKSIWDKIAYLGLEEQDEFKNREVVLMNKLVFISALMMFGMIPFEVIINGWELVWLEVVIVLLCLSALYLNYLKWFTFAKFYFYVVAVSIIFGLGLAIGKGSYNELFFFPTFIFPAMLFHNRAVIITLSVIAGLLFILQSYLMEFVPPVFDVPAQIKLTIRYLFQIIVFTIVFFEIYYFKTQNYRFQKLLKQKNEEIEHKSQEIIDSINYAKRIQEAILLPVHLVKNHLPDSFVIYKPKDIVAGDFYWIEEIQDSTLVSVADCTGHGVPGAMVSVVCHNALNSALREFDLTDPGEILDKTRDLVTRQFSKSTQEVKDGMDISLVSLEKDYKNGFRKLHWAGANNPLWILRKGAQEIEEIKPDKQAVGRGEHLKKFTTHSINLQKGDLIYIFSDGFADQFGGERGKKYKYKPFKDLLVLHANKSMKEQEETILHEFEIWKKDLEQVDDICIIGIRI
ncbi:MAG: serine/threonine-protein phosphatase [Crocinitomicaceae bacterium]|nr:serine/threonine-protein phosphatase [Crocinitomicaceae bacterium]